MDGYLVKVVTKISEEGLSYCLAIKDAHNRPYIIKDEYSFGSVEEAIEYVKNRRGFRLVTTYSSVVDN